MDKDLIKKALEECIMAIEALHPILDENEPCIAFTSHDLAKKALVQLEAQPEDSADVCPCGAPAVTAGWCEECIEYVADEHDQNG